MPVVIGSIAGAIVLLGLVLIVAGVIMIPSGVRGVDETAKSIPQLIAEVVKKLLSYAFGKDTPKHLRLIAIGFLLIIAGVLALIGAIWAANVGPGDSTGGDTGPTTAPNEPGTTT